MNREDLHILIDKVIGIKGIMRSSAWWVRRLLREMISYTDNTDSRLRREVVSGSSLAMKPNIFYVYEGDALSISLVAGKDDGLVKEYCIKIICTGTPTITMPTEIVWANDAPPEFTAGKTYQISIIDNLAVVATFNQ